MSLRQQPAVTETKLAKLPAVVDTALSNGLRVLAARKPGIPMVQVRLRFDVAEPRNWGEGPLEAVASATIGRGTATRNRSGHAARPRQVALAAHPGQPSRSRECLANRGSWLRGRV